MIVWLNGTFGCGKTTTITAELRSLIPSSRLFDPETVGYMLRPSLADHPGLRLPALATVAAAGGGYSHGIGAFTGQHLIAPQTILTRAYWSRSPLACAKPGSRRSISCSMPMKNYCPSASRARLKYRRGAWLIWPSTGRHARR
ncbi:MAG: hypothetical protein ACR2MP_17965 [Streptosporangiaceae bacterium]